MQAFIDENTVRGIMVVAAVADPSALEHARRTLTGLRMKGQERIHFKSDRRILFEVVGKHGLRDQLTYHHLRAKQEPMLWIPDAVAWCLAKGGEWPDRVRPLITKIMQVE